MNYNVKKIFIAAPGDVVEEFNIIKNVADKINILAGEIFQTHIEVHRGLNVAPAMGRPQEVILNQIKINEFDYFIGVLWTRFGTPTGKLNPHTDKQYKSGTEEEFYTAYTSYIDNKKPDILIYACKRDPEYDKIDVEQFNKVKNFLEQLNPQGLHPALYSSYVTIKEFEENLFVHLFNMLKTNYQKENYHV